MGTVSQKNYISKDGKGSIEMFVMKNRRIAIYTISSLLCLLLLVVPSFALSFEQIASRRQSMRSYTFADVSEQQLLDVLWAAYGYSNGRRNLPRVGAGYSLIVYTVNETGSYRYIPESNSLVIHDLSVDKQSIRPYDSNWPSDASEVFVLTWDENKEGNHYFAAAEIGCLAQNVYLAAASNGLGTCLVGMINSGQLRNILQLSSSVTPLFVMPLGNPTGQYVDSTPEYNIMTGNLPPVQYSALTFEESVRNLGFSQEWSAEPLSLQMQSQLLWAAYGYSTAGHRTVPSAYGVYPLVVYVSNATGVYRYSPESHSVTEINGGDKRLNITKTLSDQVWAAAAPEIFIVAYDTSYEGDGGFLPHLFAQADSGCVVQQLFLEAAAWNLAAGVISESSEEWDGNVAQELRNVIGLSGNVIPLHVVAVGMPENSDSTPPTIGIPTQDPDLSSIDPNQKVTVTVQVSDEGVGVSGVVLSYRINGGQTWIDTAMPSVAASTYSGEILGLEEGNTVQYKILAYDKAENLAVEDNSGNYYSYTIIPEIHNFLAVIFVLLVVMTAILIEQRRRPSRD